MRPEDFLKGIKENDIAILARAITLVESTNSEHQAQAQKLLQSLPHSNKISMRVGISGTPGVGKSTFIEAFGLHAINQGKKVAVLAIDPTSQITGGSILGDKTRMQKLASRQEAFIRPTPGKAVLGGVAQKTRESIYLCEAFGFDLVLIETIGVGQSEVSVDSMVDFFMVLMAPAQGDELQGIKRGILEMADLLIVTKADGATLNLAHVAKHDLEQAIHILRNKNTHWTPSVCLVSSTIPSGLDVVWKKLNEFFKTMQSNHDLEKQRQKQLTEYFEELVWLNVLDNIQHESSIVNILEMAKQDIVAQKHDIYTYAQKLTEQILAKLKK